MERNIDLDVYIQSIPVPTSIVSLIRDDTPVDYEHISTGLSIPVAHFMASNLKVIHIYWFIVKIITIIFCLHLFLRCIRPSGKR